jgi:hypothetical protein
MHVAPEDDVMTAEGTGNKPGLVLASLASSAVALRATAIRYRRKIETLPAGRQQSERCGRTGFRLALAARG